MKKKIFKLGEPGVVDKATGFKGELSMYYVWGENCEVYWFKPAEINKKTGTPLAGFFVTSDRIDNCSKQKLDFYPVQVVGTIVTDRNSGFSGTAVEMIIHKNGCVHFSVQSTNRKEDGGRSETVDFPIQSLIGDAVPEWDEARQRKEKKERPSPEPSQSLANRSAIE